MALAGATLCLFFCLPSHRPWGNGQPRWLKLGVCIKPPGQDRNLAKMYRRQDCLGEIERGVLGLEQRQGERALLSPSRRYQHAFKPSPSRELLGSRTPAVTESIRRRNTTLLTRTHDSNSRASFLPRLDRRGNQT